MTNDVRVGNWPDFLSLITGSAVPHVGYPELERRTSDRPARVLLHCIRLHRRACLDDFFCAALASNGGLLRRESANIARPAGFQSNPRLLRSGP
jgi:hypothetical protein